MRSTEAGSTSGVQGCHQSTPTTAAICFVRGRQDRVVIEEWRRHYNTVRPHSVLGWKPPAPETIAPMDQRPIMH